MPRAARIVVPGIACPATVDRLAPLRNEAACKLNKSIYMYISLSSASIEGLLMPKAKLFMNGGSQAVRLPAEFRFEGTEVEVRRDLVTGDVVLSTPKKTFDVEAFAAFIGTLNVPADFLADRDQPPDDFHNPFHDLTSND